MNIPGIEFNTYWNGTIEQVRDEFILALDKHIELYKKIEKARFKDKIIPDGYKDIVHVILHDTSKLFFGNLRSLLALEKYTQSTFYAPLHRNTQNYALILNLYLIYEILKLKGVLE